jgi:hypothetical protein
MRLAIFIMIGLLVILGATVYPAFYYCDLPGTKCKPYIEGVVISRQALKKNAAFRVPGGNVGRDQGVVGVPHP